jgi:hypothetical protein
MTTETRYYIGESHKEQLERYAKAAEENCEKYLKCYMEHGYGWYKDLLFISAGYLYKLNEQLEELKEEEEENNE